MEHFCLEIEQQRSIFRRNNYPVTTIDKCVTVKRFWTNCVYVPKKI